MQDEEKITNPSMGSNEPGSEIQEDLPGVYAGSDTQLEITALGGKKHKNKKGVMPIRGLIKQTRKNQQIVINPVINPASLI